MKVANVRKHKNGYALEPEVIHIYRGLLVKLQEAKKNKKDCCK